MSQETDNVQLVKDFFEVLSSGDLEKLRPMFHPDAAWIVQMRDIPGAGVHKGRDLICDEFLAPVRGLFEDGDPKVTVLNAVAQGDQVALQTVAKGTFRNGKTYDNRYAWFITVKDGMLFELNEYMDSLYISKVTA